MLSHQYLPGSLQEAPAQSRDYSRDPLRSSPVCLSVCLSFRAASGPHFLAVQSPGSLLRETDAEREDSDLLKVAQSVNPMSGTGLQSVSLGSVLPPP